jgi:hypothetical protein
MSFRQQAIAQFEYEFGAPSRRTLKVVEWKLGHELSAVMQVDQPSSGQAALIWLPYPSDGSTVPEIAVEYPGESGRHSNTYAAPGLRRGLPAMRLTVSSQTELNQTLDYIKAMRDLRVLPEVKAEEQLDLSVSQQQSIPSLDGLPPLKPIAPRREAIPKAVQREVWQRDGGKCVECGTREKLCFDHIVPFSRGGSNTVRNVQLLCEHCNCSKGNRI